MPIYEYGCKKCGHVIEKFQKMSDPPCVTCPACQADALQKLISKTSFQLKGTGWYVTDFRDQGKGKATQSSQASTSSTSESGGSDGGQSGQAQASGDGQASSDQ